MDKAKYQMIIQWSDEDNCFLVAFPDFPGSYWRTHGDTYDEAFANGKEALESLILAFELSSLLETVYLLRSPENARRLHRALEWSESEEAQPQTVDELKQELGIEP